MRICTACDAAFRLVHSRLVVAQVFGKVCEAVLLKRRNCAAKGGPIDLRGLGGLYKVASVFKLPRYCVVVSGEEEVVYGRQPRVGGGIEGSERSGGKGGQEEEEEG